MFNEYAWPVAGMEHVVLDCIGKGRLIATTSDGGPNAPENPVPARVSTTRQGVMPMKVRGFGAVGVVARGRTSARFGCQYNGAGQWRRGALSYHEALGHLEASALLPKQKQTGLPRASSLFSFLRIKQQSSKQSHAQLASLDVISMLSLGIMRFTSSLLNRLNPHAVHFGLKSLGRNNDLHREGP